MKWISCFNTKFEEFMKDLIYTFPDDKDFIMFKQSYNLLKIVDDKKPVQMFRVYAPKYYAKIEQRDETFFLEHDFNDELATADGNLSVEVLIKLKGYWQSLSSENKDIIWRYLNLLYKINDKICI
jgi:hypothetical protein